MTTVLEKMHNLKVYKFGGASIATPQKMQALLPIIIEAEAPLVMVASAYGKTTNALESIAGAACRGSKDDAHNLAQVLELEHTAYAKSLLSPASIKKAASAMAPIFTELQWAIDDADSGRYDYSYDQIVCIGELLSTRLFSLFLEEQNIPQQWIDVRDVIRTDETWRDARVDWPSSQSRARQVMQPLLDGGKVVITQGFIGATADNASVTLGREGSDYTAALLAAWLGAESVTIWKDVPGFLNADPRLFENTVTLESISYHEVIEMTFYGAQIIHPKTIKPLQNAGIPLLVKCFLDKNAAGTVIQSEVENVAYPPLIVWKGEQILLQVTTRDYSFITEENLSRIYRIFSEQQVKINLIQNAAISFVACIDNREEKVTALIAALEADYKVLRNENACLLTVRHYTPEIVFELTKGRYILLEQKTRGTMQVVLK